VPIWRLTATQMLQSMIAAVDDLSSDGRLE